MTAKFCGAKRDRLLKLQAEGKSRKEIARIVGISYKRVLRQLWWANMPPEKYAEKRERLNAPRRLAIKSPRTLDVYVTVASRPSHQQIKDRDARFALPVRDLTAAFFGDPPIGLSALERRA